MVDNRIILEQFLAYWLAPNRELVISLGDLYADKIHFIDPVGQKRGLNELQHYFSQLTQNTLNYQFNIHSSNLVDDKAFIVWKMQYQHKKLNNGQIITVEGLSELHFADGKIIYHRDYFDLGSMIYEQLPLLGRLIKLVKKRLAQ